MRARVRDLDAERDVGDREPVRGARAHGDEAVAQPGGDLRDSEPREVTAGGLDPGTRGAIAGARTASIRNRVRRR